MNQAQSFPRSSIGKKFLMAITGLMLLGFVLGHMIGNLKAFQGAEKFDAYALFLKEVGKPVLGKGDFLWMARLGLLAAVGIHIFCAVSLTLQNRKARPVGYKKTAREASTYASRTMLWGGIILALYVIYHILHLTTGHAHHDFGSSVYGNMVAGFKQWPVSLAYVIAQIALGMHLFHGFWSAFRTLGANNPNRDKKLRAIAVFLAVAITAGYLSIPVSVMAGIIQ
ncbi:MAG: succinate dehydrogenase cytochrome b subunit [Candidatus Eisenbacteria bacterium]|uniref:Succinate dehydrogenase cytochrome b subunit n=1 Tax=Eiseniibacteriota bacterium TaxID=2212470 RepID=A0A7Y2E8L1_UNCEI|nr:succinate dehydrogenase cytochrome b subunit [Candidatus Eisenbacteria bacterium]